MGNHAHGGDMTKEELEDSAQGGDCPRLPPVIFVLRAGIDRERKIVYHMPDS